jgi:alpha-tubulin suppressor-like RCC1 family protein
MGQLGNNGAKNAMLTTPSRVAGGLKFVSLSAGNFHTCGVTASRVAYCWGENQFGQLGDGTTIDRYAPVAVISAPPFVSIFAGGGRTNFADVGHTCALTAQGSAYCWGYNGYGEAGTGVAGNMWLQPSAVVGGISFRSLTGGGFHTCGVAVSGESYCWGDGSNGALGNDTQLQRPAPTRVTGGVVFDTLAAGEDATCGVASNGLYCWGSDYSGQLGVGRQQLYRLGPTLVLGNLALKTPALGLFHTCARTEAGAAYCWGWNFFTQLGAGTRNPEVVPSPLSVNTTERFEQMALGSSHSCGLTAAGSAYCWGSNDYGELGDGTRKQRSLPVRVRSQ